MADFVSIITNVGESLSSIERLISGAAYVMGAFVFFHAVYHLREFGQQRAAYSISTSGYPSMVWLLVSLCLLYLPTALATFTQTVFGYDSPLAYSTLTNNLFAQYGNVTSVMIRLVQIAGVLWFLQGLSMIAKSTKPGADSGGRGIAYVFGGILAYNIQGTANMLSSTSQMLSAGNYSLGLASFFNNF